MPNSSTGRSGLKGRRCLWMLGAFFILLWIAGGASRADVAGQMFVRAGAWIIVLVAIIWKTSPHFGTARPVWWLLFLTIGVLIVQLVPLPPAIWGALPGRLPLAMSGVLAGEPGIWRPLSLSPGGTRNALASLVVPAVVLLLASQLRREQHWHLVAILLVLVIASAILGTLQFAGARFDHPLINDQPGLVVGSFANRNHFALFAAVGCALVLAWGLRGTQAPLWRVSTAVGVVIVLVLMVLATGSRSGLLLAAIAVVLGGLNVRHEIGRYARRLPKRVALPLLASVVLLLVAAIGISVSLDRAASVQRATELLSGDDMRVQALPTLISMTGKYFPAGSGFGTFDPVFRMDEPAEMLSPLYFNLAHNDLLQTVLEGGLAGLLLLLAALALWGRASLKAWRRDGGTLNRLGSIVILLAIIASVTDYPVRTPMIMAVVALASVWLLSARVGQRGDGGASLPRSTRAL
jgi:O-antigen ligase